jgi:hypothetical protein
MFQTHVIQKIETHFVFNTFPENLVVYEIIVKTFGTNREATDENIIQRVHFACWVTEAAVTHIQIM